MEHDGTARDDPSGLELLASAIAGRALRVAWLAPGEQVWTDGTTLFLDAGADPRDRLESLAVQASLLACGGLAPGIMRELGRRAAVAARYLAVEGHRALLANAALLPPAVSVTADRAVASSVDSPEASLAVARGRAPLAAPPANFGVIRPRKLLGDNATEQRSAAGGTHAPRRGPDRDPVDLPDDATDDEQTDGFSSPIGGGGALGKLMRRMLGASRRTGGNGQPGADSATHRMRGGIAGSGTVLSTATDDRADDDRADSGGITYPEWDLHRGRYRQDWCTVQEIEPPAASEAPAFRSHSRQLRHALSRLGRGPDRYHRQPSGDDLDVDAVVEARVEAIAGSAPDDSVYLDSARRRRDLSVLLLLDISGSVAEAASHGQTIHEQQRLITAALAVALYELGDRVALYAFRSQGRAAVQLLPVKRFHETLDSSVMRRLGGLAPGSYSRLGAAIRHGTSVLSAQGGTPRRLLVVVSDGLAYDHGYERAYGAADSRRALAEARRAGIGALCLTVGARTADDDLARVFGSAAYARVDDPAHASRIILPLFRSALRATNARRRVGRVAARPGAAATRFAATSNRSSG